MSTAPSYQTPYPVKRADGSQIIWSWDTQSWGPYSPPHPGTGHQAAPPIPAGTPDAPDASGIGASNAPDRAVDTSGGAPSADRSPAGPTFQQGRRGAPAPVRRAPPGRGLLGGLFTERDPTPIWARSTRNDR